MVQFLVYFIIGCFVFYAFNERQIWNGTGFNMGSQLEKWIARVMFAFLILTWPVFIVNRLFFGKK